MEGLQMKYFVLSPTKQSEYGSASCKALLAYAEEIEIVNEELAKDLRMWVYNIQHGSK